jgi:dephospho-CoA kinase
MNFTRKPLRLGLTGGIGSGKSTVAELLRAQGAAVIDADAISRSLTAPHGAAIAAIAAAFGEAFVGTDGALDRERMRAHVFANAQARQTLEAIIHPLVALETQRQAQSATDMGQHTLVFDIPLLVESGRWRSQLDRILVVDCSEATQIQRVTARSQLTQPMVEKIIASQVSRSQRVKAADWVIYNDHISLNDLAQSIGCLPIPRP